MSGVEIPTGYTPGPWQVGVDADEYSVHREEDGRRGLSWSAVGPGDFEAVALVVVPSSAGMDDVREANARLIALAPEMAADLAALRSQVSALTEERGRLREALEWYGEQARLARIIHAEGDEGRRNLAADGGNRATAALSPKASQEPQQSGA